MMKAPFRRFYSAYEGWQIIEIDAESAEVYLLIVGVCNSGLRIYLWQKVEIAVYRIHTLLINLIRAINLISSGLWFD